jgi:Ser/Thr protein kinase RdoA (MazF antagonist)
VTEALLERIRGCFEEIPRLRRIRLHGDLHRGNILWSEQGPVIVDLDDCRTGPAIQDLWMLVAGSRQEMSLQLADFLSGYRTFCEFDRRELALVEALRALRFMHHAAWLARRWADPAFPIAFPWFGTPSYWEGHVSDLREQILKLEEPPIDPG